MFKIKHPVKKKTYLDRIVPIFEINKEFRIGSFAPQIYNQYSVDRIIEIFSKKELLAGELRSSDDYVTGAPEHRHRFISDATHIITGIFQEDNFLMVHLRFIDNNKGRDALKMLGEGIVVLQPTIKGRINRKWDREDPGIIEVNDLISIDLIPLRDEYLPQDIDWIEINS